APVQEQGTCEWCDGHAIMCAECITKMKSEQYKAILTTAEAMNKAPADILNQVVSERFGTPAPTADAPCPCCQGKKVVDNDKGKDRPCPYCVTREYAQPPVA